VSSELRTYKKPSQLNSKQGINLETVYRSLLNIVARLDDTQYTQGMLRQTAERELDDLADPASVEGTSQG
jgi:hypothetical protein